MKTNFKKIFASITLATMCMVPMTANAIDGQRLSVGRIEPAIEKEIGLSVQTFPISNFDDEKPHTDVTIVCGVNDDLDTMPIHTRTGINVNRPNAMVTYVFPETEIVGTYGSNLKNGNLKNMVTYVFPETEIVGTYGSNVKTPSIKEKEYLNAYNQIAGHAIKTTTVGVVK